MKFSFNCFIERTRILSCRAFSAERGGLGAKTLLVGMNPGHGMGNTGVPFGCPEQVRETLKIRDLEVHQPPILHPKRPVYGLDCPKPEVSGRRIWSFLSELYGSPEEIHQNVYIPRWTPTPQIQPPPLGMRGCSGGLSPCRFIKIL